MRACQQTMCCTRLGKGQARVLLPLAARAGDGPPCVDFRASGSCMLAYPLDLLERPAPLLVPFGVP